ncbi:MAG TPA: hypothetical protein VF498_01885 [Anaerolineales bacterium]
MKIKLTSPVSAAIAIAIGLIVLLGYFLNQELLVTLRVIFLRWAVILAAVSLLVGLINLASVHIRKITTGQSGSFYSAILILALALTILVAGYFGPTAPWSLWIFNNIQVPIESSLMALLAVILAYASARLLNRRLNLFTLVFVATVLVVLVGTAALPVLELPILSEVRAWIAQVPASGGARGILLGVALGTVATGLRVLIGADRPYGG